MATSRRFSAADLDALARAKIIGVRSGVEHEPTGVWVVVVDGRVYVRSWNDKPTGWYRAFLSEPRGTLEFGTRAVEVRAKRPRSKKAREAVSEAYAEKYDTRASEKWVQGFREEQRELTTLELVPE